MLETKLDFRNTMLIILEIFFITFITSFLLVIVSYSLNSLLESHAFNYPEEMRVLVLLISSIILLPIVTYFRVQKFKKYEYWKLENNKLTQGNPITVEIDLNKVHKVIIGLPTKTINNPLLKLFAKREIESSNSYISNAIILKLDNSQYLPLYLFGYEGGFAIMNDIVEKLNSKIENDYVFNKFEIKVFKRLKLSGFNKIIKF